MGATWPTPRATTAFPLCHLGWVNRHVAHSHKTTISQHKGPARNSWAEEGGDWWGTPGRESPCQEACLQCHFFLRLIMRTWGNLPNPTLSSKQHRLQSQSHWLLISPSGSGTTSTFSTSSKYSGKGHPHLRKAIPGTPGAPVSPSPLLAIALAPLAPPWSRLDSPSPASFLPTRTSASLASWSLPSQGAPVSQLPHSRS